MAKKGDHEDLMARVQKNTQPGPGGEMVWIGAKTKGGHGVISYEGKIYYVRRLLYELNHGEIPKGCYVFSTSTVKNDVNPEHLYLRRPGYRSPDALPPEEAEKIMARMRAERMSIKRVSDTYNFHPMDVIRLFEGKLAKHPAPVAEVVS